MAKNNKKSKRALGHLRKRQHVSGRPGMSAQNKLLQQALTLHQAGSLRQAEALYRQILQAEPDHPDALHFLGLLAYQAGKSEIAVELLSRSLSNRPDHVDGHNILGSALYVQGKLEEAVASFRRVLALKPDYAEAHYNLGITLHAQGMSKEAAASYRRALNLKADYADAHYNLGLALKDQGKLEEAITSFHRALSLKPGYAEAHHNLGVIFSELGKTDDAIASFRKALSLKPDCVLAYKGLSLIMKYTEDDEVIHAMKDLYNTKGALSDADRADLGFALGKLFEDRKDYDRSFDFILQANLLKRRSYQYSIQSDYDLFEKIKNTFSSDFFAVHMKSGSQDSTPIFILGMPRSGTTLVEQILASHPLVYGAGELTALARLVNDICERRRTAAQFPECIMDLSEDALQGMGADYVKSIREYSDNAVFITDKMPRNFLYVGFIKTILPRAKVIHCVRDPMDTCFSIFKNVFMGPLRYAYDMDELGRYYNLYHDLMAHWEKVLPGFMHTLKYEELISDQQNQTKRLLDFCGLPWDAACLTFHQTKRRVSTASLAQVRQPIYKDSVALWRRYEKHLQPLKKALHGREP
jgi:Tfp pilus assembly protein PilF